MILTSNRVKRLYRARAYYKRKDGSEYSRTYHFQTKSRREAWAKLREDPPSYLPYLKADRVEIADSEPIIFAVDHDPLI